MTQVKWYFRPVAVIVAILCVGPFALPLLWISPAFKKSHKVLITVIVIVLTLWLIKASFELYDILLDKLQELKEILK